MGKFNLKKKAFADTISDKQLCENRDNMGLCNKEQGVVGKNINLSLPTKDKDNTVPFNQQLNSMRQNKTEVSITEAGMDKKIVEFKSTDKKQVMDINVESQKHDSKKTDAFVKAENAAKKDTQFWDDYVGVQLEGTMKNIDKNIPDSASQLQNNPDRFKGETVKKMVMAAMKDADAMLFHIYATASKENRSLTSQEEQQVVDIHSGKTRLLAQSDMVEPVRRSLEYSPDPIIKEEIGKAGVYENDGSKIDEFKSCDEAKANYPEAEIEVV